MCIAKVISRLVMRYVSCAVILMLMLSGCASDPRLACEFTPDERAVIRANLDSFLRERLGESYEDYSSPRSIVGGYQKHGSLCYVYLEPYHPEKMFIHGEAMAFFDPRDLAFTDLSFMQW